MLASWRGTRFEVVQVLREVVDNVLKDHEVSDQVLYHRARVCLDAAATPWLSLTVVLGSPVHWRHFQVDTARRVRCGATRA